MVKNMKLQSSTLSAIVSLPLCLAALLLLGGCPSGDKLPSDGREVQFENRRGGRYDGWKFVDRGSILINLKRRYDDSGEEIVPQKAVVHEHTLHVLWEDGHIDKIREPNK